MAGVDVVSPMSSQTGPWLALSVELAAWAAAGRTATFWWRDDDATRRTGRLSRLLEIAGRTPLMLAVIPAAARDDLVSAVEDHCAAGGRALVAQHGYAHANHAPPREKSAEYGPHRPAEVMLAELATGRERLEAMFGDRFRPILTPPWNRIDPALLPRLAEAGLRGLSTFGARPLAVGPATVNVHIDIIDWRGTRGFAGDEAVLGAAVAHLFARRTGAAEVDEPTGLLTHHLDHDEACWRFIDRFIAAVGSHPAVRWSAVPATAMGS